jgi:hypothetical protein
MVIVRLREGLFTFAESCTITRAVSGVSCVSVSEELKANAGLALLNQDEP